MAHSELDGIYHIFSKALEIKLPREARSSFFNKLALRWQLRTRSSLQRDTVYSGAKHLHTVTFETSFNGREIS